MTLATRADSSKPFFRIHALFFRNPGEPEANPKPCDPTVLPVTCNSFLGQVIHRHSHSGLCKAEPAPIQAPVTACLSWIEVVEIRSSRANDAKQAGGRIHTSHESCVRRNTEHCGRDATSAKAMAFHKNLFATCSLSPVAARPDLDSLAAGRPRCSHAAFKSLSTSSPRSMEPWWRPDSARHRPRRPRPFRLR